MKRLLALSICLSMACCLLHAKNGDRPTGPKVKNQKPVKIYQKATKPRDYTLASVNGMIIPGVSSNLISKRKKTKKIQIRPRKRITGPRVKNAKPWDRNE